MNSNIILCKDINIDKDYINVLSYSETQMLQLCQQNATATRNNYSFIRKTGEIYTDVPYDTCLQSNYMAFQNPTYSNKWFFAWIVDIKYISNNNTQIFYEIDSWSTWFDKWSTKTCFVNRHHVNDDIIGRYTQEEGLNIGEVVQETEEEDISLSSYGYVCIISSWNPSTEKQFGAITVYNKQVFGKNVYLIPANTMGQLLNLGLFILKTNADHHVDDIDTIFYVPDALIDPSQLREFTANVGGQEFTFYDLQNNFTIQTFNNTISKVTSYSDFTPKNNKCYVYPYNYLYVSNNNGNSNVFKYENFSGENCIFTNELALSVGVSGQLIPRNYKKQNYALDEAIPLGKYPTVSWSSDSYTNWLTEQAVNIPTDIAFSAFGAGQQYNTDSNSKSAKQLNTAVSIASSVANQIGNFYSASLLPNVTHGTNTADVNWSGEHNTFTFRGMRTKTEFLRIIDDYFTRFGYKINRLIKPNITGRQNWNYVEIGENEDIGYGSVPANDMEIINRACRRGVTIWHNHANVGNYSLSNNVI